MEFIKLLQIKKEKGMRMSRKVKPDEILYHVALSKDMVCEAEYVFMPGDPGRCEILAKAFDNNPKYLASHREYTSFLAGYKGHKILVCSTGIGGPSTAICMEELAVIGLKYFIRVGTCGSIQENVNLGDVIINTGAVRLEGTSHQYAPATYPAIASNQIINALYKAAVKVSKVPYHKGLSISTDAFYPGQERYDNYIGYVPRHFQGTVEEWRKLNALNYEMENSVIFVLARVFGLKAGAINGVVAKRTDSEVLDGNAVDFYNTQNILREAIDIHLESRRQ
jgi:uridine phosphorylase